MAKLVLVRHTEAKWNEMGLWQGWVNDDLSDEGKEKSKEAGAALRDFKFDRAYSSPLDRAEKTLAGVLEATGQTNLPVTKDKALMERDYGIYTGKNKWKVKEEIGEEEFQKIRRGWDCPIPEGETMRQVHDRVVAYYEKEILPKVKEGEDVVIASHGNTLRALVKYLENLDEEEVAKLEFGIGEAWVYEVNQEGKILNKEVRNKNPLAGKQ